MKPQAFLFLFAWILPLVCAAERPNIIFIMADDLGYGDLGCYGQALIQTPRLDQLAAEGMRFTQHYTGSPVCAPSRAILMTGKHSGHVSVRGNSQWPGPEKGQMPLSTREITIARVLQEAGYTTGMFGKWGLGNPGTPGDPLKRGWDTYFGYTDQVLAHNYYPEFLLKDGERIPLDNEVKYLSKTEWHDGLGSYSTKQVDYSHDLIVEAALEFIEANQDKPFFLYLPFTIPHDNGEAPVGFRQEVPDFGPYANTDWDRESKAYASMITRMDKDIGRVVDRIDQLGLGKQTLILFVSDNGPMTDSHEFVRRFNSAAGLRGFKRDLYEGGIRSPFIARWTHHIQPGQVSDHLSAFFDFFPTALEVAGLPPHPQADGISYLPELLGKWQPQHPYLYWEFPLTFMGAGNGFQTAVRMGNWKAVRRDLLNNPTAPIELYNLESDPSESINVAADYPEVVTKVRHIMRDAHIPSDDFPHVPLP